MLHYRTDLHRTTAPRAAFITAALLLPLTGCHKAPPAPPAKPAAPPKISDADLKQYKPNEAGSVMIVMYHNFDPAKPNADLNRKPDQFRDDLKALYARNYCPVTVSEFVDNKMDVPAGKTPIVLTFDDARPTQFQIIMGRDGQDHIDANCAVGIMETFHKQHPDWPLKGTFFVLPKEGSNYDPFAQPESVHDKFNYLLKKGYEVANHTSTHSDMHSMTASKVRWELATALRDIKQIAPEATMQVMALPYGRLPRQKDALAALVSGTDGSTSYKHKAVLRAAWRPCLSPLTRADKKLEHQTDYCIFDPYRLERIKPNPRQAKEAGTFEYWIRHFDAHPTQRYRSDGNLKVAAVPASLKTIIDPARVKAQGKILQLYSLTSSKGGGGLSVE